MLEITWTDRKVKDLFSNNKFIGDVIRFTAILELELDCLLAQYFLREDHIDDGITLLIDNLTFNTKVETLAKIPVRKSIMSFQRAVAGLRRFRRIRNIAAHNWTITYSDVKKLLNDAEYKQMLIDYPDGLVKDYRETSICLHRLSKVKEFRSLSGKDVVDWNIRLAMPLFQ